MWALQRTDLKRKQKEILVNEFDLAMGCHHPRWLSGVPKSQMMRIRRNCDDEADYDSQTAIIIERFQEKGLRLKELAKIKEAVLKLNRDKMLDNKKKRSITMDWPFSRQYKQVEKNSTETLANTSER